ncbi:MAG: hypothetical protein IJ324_09585 [Lachnospiraceae bacterium]|nr:hypothetical protein [Lachnospiraceae bacterium]
MSKSDLRKKADIAPNTMTKLRRDIEYEGMTLLWVYVSPTSTVEKCANRIYAG